ncbi:cache domain-containing protein [Paenibacillus sp. F411]|uniref:cache domain-containing protein n=1 Tax=Paenibacillus sp. F411 TaxID=2820239 RepID=UPI001AAE2856|nr:cache domain-containing protein [Paenibacillus sp. F411]MBO2944881.1 cache domain-containing protein [Paenibacillus sp. F411]
MVGFKRMIKSHTIFIRFVISYFLVLSVTVIIGAIYYHQLLNIYTKDSVKSGLLSLNNGIQLVQARFAEVDNMVTQMMLDKEVATLFQRNDQPIVNSDYYQFRLIQQKLKSYSLTNTFIDEMYLLMDDISVIISSKYVADHLPEFTAHFMNYEDLTYASWKQQVMDEYHYMDVWPSRLVTKEHIKEAYITYVHSYPTGRFNSDQGAIVIHIKEEAFTQYFRNMSMMQNGLFLAFDQNNDILASYNYNS